MPKDLRMALRCSMRHPAANPSSHTLTHTTHTPHTPRRAGAWPKDLEEGFEVLDAEGGAGWDLACKVREFHCFCGAVLHAFMR